MIYTFELYELSIYFNFINSSICNENHENNQNYEKIYNQYREKINTTNQNTCQYIFDIVNFNSSPITYDSGFDIFNILDYTIHGKQTNLIDFNINCSMKLKKYCIESKMTINQSFVDNYVFDKNFDIHDFICGLNKNNLLSYNNSFIINTFIGHSGYYLYPRSSTGLKTPLRVANSVGIIDSGYRGNIKGCLTNIDNSSYTLQSGERYMQICPGNISYPFVIKEVGDLNDLGGSSRGNGGFGSTGQ